MEATVVKIGEKTFELIFSLGVFKLLGKKLGIGSFDGVVQAVIEAIDMGDHVEFDKLDTLHALIVAAVESNPTNRDTVTEAELEALFLSDLGNQLKVIGEVINGVFSSLPVQEMGKIQAQAQEQLKNLGKRHGTKSSRTPAGK